MNSKRTQITGSKRVDMNEKILDGICKMNKEAFGYEEYDDFHAEINDNMK